MIHQDFIELFALGLKPIPLVWDQNSKSASSHCIAHSEVTDENYTDKTFGNFVKSLEGVNGIAIKLFAPFGCLDFDLKNTDDKTIFEKWLKHVNALDDEILEKICIEKTRNAGYHVYIKYSKLTSKKNLAKSESGAEVIALYTGGTLSYCDPTPGYKMYHNEWQDLSELTDDQYDILVSSAISYNLHNDPLAENKEPVKVEYPVEYENICLQFDKNITDDVFDILLNEMGLFSIPDYRYGTKDKFAAYLRKGSKAKYSAKVYFGAKRVLIFSSSIAGYPTWNDRQGENDHSWSLSPTKLLYYKNDKDWTSAIEELKLISESIGLELIEHKPVTNQDLIPKDRLRFPYDVFPDQVQKYISSHNFQNEYLAGFALAAFSTAIGNSVTLIANDGYFVKPILYMAIVAPPGASKSPALKSMFKVINEADSLDYKQFSKEREDYKVLLSEYKNQKKGSDIKEPIAPIMRQMVINDSTIEMAVKILKYNPTGCCVVADELAGFLKRMVRYEGDEKEKWLEMWSGGTIKIQRMAREEDVLENPFCSIVGGIQPGVLDALSTKENAHNGFYHRFLFVYPKPMNKPDWVQYVTPENIKTDFSNLFHTVLSQRDERAFYRMSGDANALYAEWYNNKNKKYNKSSTDNPKGIIAKYQDYCLRFSIILQVMHDGDTRGYIVDANNMERAIRLTEYFFGNMHKAMKVLAPDTPIDKLAGSHLDFYIALPHSFTSKTAVEIASNHNIKAPNCKMILKRWCEKGNEILTKSTDKYDATYEKNF
jgi:hypothetical protein